MDGDGYEFTQKITFDPETTEIVISCMGPDGPGNELGFFLNQQTRKIVVETPIRSHKTPVAHVIAY